MPERVILALFVASCSGSKWGGNGGVVSDEVISSFVLFKPLKNELTPINAGIPIKKRPTIRIIVPTPKRTIRL